MMRRSRMRAPTWSSIAALDRPLFGFAILLTHRLSCPRAYARACPAISVNANKIGKFPTARSEEKTSSNRTPTPTGVWRAAAAEIANNRKTLAARAHDEPLVAAPQHPDGI